MKVFFKYGFSAYSGMVDQMVYQTWFDNKMCMGRRFSYPELTENNAHIGSIGKNLTTVFGGVAAGYMADLKKYVQRNKRDNMPRNVENYHPMPGPLPILVQMMFNWYDSDPEHINLTAVTIADIVALDADVCTIKRAIDAGYLRKVKNYQDLTANIQ